MTIEEPKYTVSLRDGLFEVRDYAEVVVAECTVTGDRQSAVRKDFRRLAGYIFGANTRAQTISMTAPVTQSVDGERIAMTAPVTQSKTDDAWLIRFTMPRGYTLDTLPVPNDPEVHLRSLPPARFAVLRFSGLAGEAKIAAQTSRLMAFAISRGLVLNGQTALARYNPPWTLWFMRRNEVMVPVLANS